MASPTLTIARTAGTKPRRLRPLEPGRVRCCVPWCGRTFPDPDPMAEIMCGRHWRLADQQLRRVHRATVRLARRYPDQARRYWHLENWVWNRIKGQVITRL